MAHKDISPEDAFDNVKPSLLQYVEMAELGQNESEPIFDEILTIEERYIESASLNQGGMKKILKTRDALTNRPVAKAILLDFEDSSKTENFLREARLTASLEHPNIMPVYDIGVDEKEGPYFIMKLVGGKNLADILKSLSANEEDANYTLRELMIIFLKVCDAVAYAHSKGIVHLDLKPENIQVGDFGEVLVCDWGLAKVLNRPEDVSEASIDLDPCIYNDVTLDGCIKGTPGYMAPEQVNPVLGPKNQKTDVYALGGILYSLLCYKVPFESDTLEKVLKETLVGDLPLPSERTIESKKIPASLEAVAMKALEIKPEWRYETASELRQEINKWMGGFATEAENASFATALWLLLKRHKAVSFLILLLFCSSMFAVYKIKQNEKIAISNEKVALENERVALENEKKAKEALDLYLKEKELTGLISEHTIDQLKVINDFYLDNLNFDKAIDFVNKTIEFQPDNEFLNALKGETHFYRQEYEEALTALKKAGQYANEEPYKKMIEIAPKYILLMEGKDFIKAPYLADLVYSFRDKHRSLVFGYETEKFTSNDKYKKYQSSPIKIAELENHLELCRLLLLRSQKSKKNKKIQLNYTYTLEDEGINLDLSNSHGLDNLGYITHLPIIKLNVENTFFWRQWPFKHYYLKAINLKNTKIKKLSYNAMINSNLNEITLSQTQYDESDIRSGVKKKIQFNIK